MLDGFASRCWHWQETKGQGQCEAEGKTETWKLPIASGILGKIGKRADRNNLNRGQFRAQVTRPLNIAHVNFKPPNSFHKWLWRVWFVTHGPLLCSLRGRARQLKLLNGNARLGAQPERTAEPFGLGSHILRVGVAGSTCKDISTFGCLVHVDVKTFVWSLDLAGRPCRHGINMHGHLGYQCQEFLGHALAWGRGAYFIYPCSSPPIVRSKERTLGRFRRSACCVVQ